MARSTDVYLNTLCLAAWAPGAPTMKLAKSVAQMYDETPYEERTMITPVNMLYIKLIKDVVDGKLDLSNRSEAQNTLLAYQDDEAFKTNKLSFSDLKDMLTPSTAPSPVNIKAMFRRVSNNIIFYRNSRRIRSLQIANQRAGASDDPDKQAALLKQIMDDAADFSEIYNSQNAVDDEFVEIDEIDFSDESSIKRALTQQHKKRDGQTIRFGWEGLNRMFGPKRSASYGEVGAIAGASHCGKSLILTHMALSHVLYNKPPETGGLTPVVLFVSLENEVSENAVQIYKTLYTNVFHKEPIGLKDDEVATYLAKELGKNGFQFLLVRRLGESFGYREYVDLVEKIEARGKRVVATYLDYVTLCKHDSCDKDRNDAKQIELMVTRFKDFAARHSIFFMTAFQLDAEASRIKLSGQTNSVKRFNESTLSDCKSALKPLDFLFFNDIEVNHKGVSYLCMAWRKHRYVHDTDKDDKYFAYRFGPLGILSDSNAKPQFVRDIYADDDEYSEGPEQQVSIF